MKRKVFVGSTEVEVDLGKPLGEGGEALVFPFGRAQVMKLFRDPSDPLYSGDDPEAVRNREGAKRRLTVHQRKLPSFPDGLPSRVIVPQELVRADSRGKIVGYVMPRVPNSEVLRSFSLADWRAKNRVDGNDVLQIFRDLMRTVQGTHARGVVIGDFNNLNVMVHDAEAYLIDADSMQWAGFPCETFTPRYVDPLICDAKASTLLMARHPDEDSDWYAFSLMLWESMLLVHPYGGVFRPKDSKQRVAPLARPLKRITVFHPEVSYPAFGTPFQTLPDELLEHYQRMLLKDVRGAFPAALLQNMRWTKCSVCGTEHARRSCPNCAPTAHPETIRAVIRKDAAADRVVYLPNGVIVAAEIQRGKLLYLYHEGGAFKRENGSTVLQMDLRRDMKFRIAGQGTIVSSAGRTFLLEEGHEPIRLAADRFREGFQIFDANGEHYFWLQGGQLMRNDERQPKNLGAVLEGQTLIWVGPSFGLTLYRAGNLQRACVFDPARPGLVTVNLPGLQGELVNVVAHFTENRCWLLAALNIRGKITNRAFLVKRDGTLLASAEALEGDDSWLGDPIRSGKCSATFPVGGGVLECLLAATSEGVVGITDNQGQLAEKLHFPATKDLVDPSCQLLYASGQGLYVVGQREVHLVTAKG